MTDFIAVAILPSKGKFKVNESERCVSPPFPARLYASAVTASDP